MISNLYKIKWVEEESKYKKEEGSITIKRQKGKEKIGRSVTVGMWTIREKNSSFSFSFSFFKIGGRKV